jgi:glyoxylase-like metal-dependent hydrolase (beta-lactamase superfamily II)
MRRKARIALAALGVATLVSFGRAAAEAQQVFNYFARNEPPALDIADLGRGLYLAKGEWGVNVGFLVGADGVLVIDSKATYSASKKVVKEIRKITSKPITKVIFTHSDSDCFNGYEAYPETAEIICSAKCRQELANGMWTLLEMNAPSGLYSSEVTARPMPEFHPAIAFDGRMTIRFGAEDIELIACGPAHTGGDVAVLFPARGVAFIGDLVFVHHEPLVQSYKGGYSFGLVTALSMLLAVNPEIRTFIPGHADPVGREELKEILRSLEETQAKVLAMFDEKKSLEDVKAAFQVPVPPKGEGDWIWPSLAVTTFRELTERRIEGKNPTGEEVRR